MRLRNLALFVIFASAIMIVVIAMMAFLTVPSQGAVLPAKAHRAAPPHSLVKVPERVLRHFPSQSAPGPGWTAYYFKAYSGGGCAVPQDYARLSPIVAEPCNITDSYFWWWGRWLSSHTLELVETDSATPYAFGFSGGHFKLEAPDSTWTYLYSPIVATWNLYQDNSETYYALSASRGDDLGVSTDAYYPVNTWDAAECGSSCS